MVFLTNVLFVILAFVSEIILSSFQLFVGILLLAEAIDETTCHDGHLPPCELMLVRGTNCGRILYPAVISIQPIESS
jgi:hypothetical protein